MTQLHGFAAGPYQTNTYLLVDEVGVTVVDPGLHASTRVEDMLAEFSRPLVAIVLTHGHIDHTREAGDLAARHQVPVWIHQADAFMLDSGEGVSEQSQVLFDAAGMVPIKDLRYFVDGEDYDFSGVSFKVNHTPGHSPGSLLLVAEEVGVAIVGDVIFRGSIGRTDLEHSDDAAMQASLRGAVWDMADELMLLPGHGPTTTMRAERQSNPFLRAAHTAG